MKRIALLLIVAAVMVFAPSAFACWKCTTTTGCVGTDVGVSGRTNCEFDGVCHVSGLCQGLTADQAPLAASYTVAAVHVVTTGTETAASSATRSQQLPPTEPQKAEKVAAAR
jgi:hypothetical protein